MLGTIIGLLVIGLIAGFIARALVPPMDPSRVGRELPSAVGVVDGATELAQCFDVVIALERERVRIQPVGELDLATAPELHSAAEEVLDAGFEQLIIDLRGLAFIDAAGIRVLSRIDREARDLGRRIVLVQGRPTIRRVFELTDTLAVLPFATDKG